MRKVQRHSETGWGQITEGKAMRTVNLKKTISNYKNINSEDQDKMFLMISLLDPLRLKRMSGNNLCRCKMKPQKAYHKDYF